MLFDVKPWFEWEHVPCCDICQASPGDKDFQGDPWAEVRGEHGLTLCDDCLRDAMNDPEWLDSVEMPLKR